jgi:hypothetical protein
MTTHRHTSKGGTKEYRAWRAMLNRCYREKDISYHRYGGRGVTVCDAWRKDFVAFLNEVGMSPSPEHSIDRFPDNNGNYEPGNVRWATRKEQDRNRRSSHTLTIDGVTKTIVEWCEASGLKHTTISRRLERGETGPKLIEPIRKKSGQRPWKNV